MDKIGSTLNELLVNLFRSVMETESRAVVTSEYSDITENDMHIIEAVGIGDRRKMSDIAKSLKVTVGTLTINMNSLEKKEYIVRQRSTRDKRIVEVYLTEKGRKAFFHHRDFHKNMIKAAIKDLDENEREALVNCLKKLDAFFSNYDD